MVASLHGKTHPPRDREEQEKNSKAICMNFCFLTSPLALWPPGKEALAGREVGTGATPQAFPPP